MFTLKKSEIEKFYDQTYLLEQDGKEWTARFFNSQEVDSRHRWRKDVLAEITQTNRYILILEKVAKDKYQIAYNSIKECYLDSLEHNIETIKLCYDFENASAPLSRAMSMINSNLIYCREHSKSSPGKIDRNPWDINLWMDDYKRFDATKLYKFSSPIRLNELRKLSARVGIVRKNKAGIYEYKESAATKFMPDFDKNCCVKQLVDNGCYLVAESAGAGKYNVIYNDLARSHERGCLAVLAMAHAVDALPVNYEEKKKMIFDELGRLYNLEKGKVELKTNTNLEH